MKGKELVNLLKKQGWVLERVNGSHNVMIKGDKTVSIPCHNKDLKPGILHGLKKATGLKD